MEEEVKLKKTILPMEVIGAIDWRAAPGDPRKRRGSPVERQALSLEAKSVHEFHQGGDLGLANAAVGPHRPALEDHLLVD